ncbi:hypothetical protein BH10ACI1_BH10ACI1_18240 [soil metagenome]
MISENDTSKNDFKTDSSQSIIGKLINFLNIHLQTFPSAYKQMPSSTKVDNEDDITQDLTNYLQDHTYKDGFFMFQFQRRKRKTRRSSDIGIIARGYASYEAFFVIEAKRLPADRKSREKEYVQGNGGGIERYKRGHHGAGLPQSAIIGYIQKENCSYWHVEINNWINELISSNADSEIIWNKTDLLKQTEDFGKTKKYSSKNTRIVNSKPDVIFLHHYLMELN